MAEAEKLLAADWGEPWQNRLTSLSEPVAAASVAQVHKAVIKASGETVALKILRPNIVKRMTRDMDVIALVAKTAHAIVPDIRRLQPKAFVAEARRAVMLELDLRLEAAAASEMADIADDTGLFKVPAIHWEMVDKNVMATDWVDGTAFSSPDILALPLEERQKLATAVIQSFLSSTFTYASSMPTCMKAICSGTPKAIWFC